MITILKNHVSPETAYVNADYPYGYRLRCTIRYWLEYDAKRGFRFWSQTTNPTKHNMWNKPKASTYCKFGGCMFLDEQEYVQWAGLSEYGDGAWAKAWSDRYRDGVPEAGLDRLDRWVCSKLTYDAHRKGVGVPLSVGLAESRKAYLTKTVIEPVTK